jgi:hypothetical protein
MNNITDIGAGAFNLYDYGTYNLELINLISSAVNMLTTIYIMFKVGNWGMCFKRIRDKQNEIRKKKEKKELEKVKRLMESIQSGADVDIDSILLSDGDEDEYKDGVMKIAHKRKKQIDSKV